MASEVQKAVSSCWKSGHYSDLIIKCGPVREFKVHKIILCSQSEWFATAVKEERFVEGRTGVVDFSADSPGAVQAALQFFYTGDYNAPAQPAISTTSLKPDVAAPTPTKRARDPYSSFRVGERPKKTKGFSVSVPVAQELTLDLKDGEQHPLLFHLDVYQIADRMLQANFKKAAETKFELTASGCWKHPEFAQAVKTVYNITPPGIQGDTLRKMIVKVAAEHATDMFQGVAFGQMMDEVAEFGKDFSAVLCGHASLNYNTQVPEAGTEDLVCPACYFGFKAQVPAHLVCLTCPSCTSIDRIISWRGGF